MGIFGIDLMTCASVHKILMYDLFEQNVKACALETDRIVKGVNFHKARKANKAYESRVSFGSKRRTISFRNVVPIRMA